MFIGLLDFYQGSPTLSRHFSPHLHYWQSPSLVHKLRVLYLNGARVQDSHDLMSQPQMEFLIDLQCYSYFFIS